MGEYKALIDTYKSDMKDLEPEETPVGYDLVELKIDGWFTILRNRNGILQFITSGGDVRRELVVGTSVPDFLAIGEWLFGTNWAKSPKRIDIFDTVQIHTLLSIESQDFIHAASSERSRYTQFEILKKLHDRQHFGFGEVTSFPFEDWKFLWDQQVVQNGYEGLVFKKSNVAFGSYKQSRMKKVVTMDYVVMGMEMGKGRLSGTMGALVGGLYKNGILTKTCTVGGGFTDSDRDYIYATFESTFLNKVMEVEGKMLFDSGAVRHPAFKAWRLEKSPENCTWQEQSG